MFLSQRHLPLTYSDTAGGGFFSFNSGVFVLNIPDHTQGYYRPEQEVANEGKLPEHDYQRARHPIRYNIRIARYDPGYDDGHDQIGDARSNITDDPLHSGRS